MILGYGVNMNELELNKLTSGIIGIAIDVHRELGPGLLESVYQRCMEVALKDAGYSVQSEVTLPVIFRGNIIEEDGYRIDLLVNNTVVVELKSVLEMNPVYEKQLGTYLKLANKPCGLLINFNVTQLKYGIKRVLNGFLPSVPSVPSVISVRDKNPKSSVPSFSLCETVP